MCDSERASRQTSSDAGELNLGTETKQNKIYFEENETDEMDH